MSPRPQELGDAVLDSVRQFTAYLQEKDRSFRRAGETVPTTADKQTAASVFWSMMRTIDRCDAALPAGATVDLRKHCRELIGPWLFRSRFFNRSFSRPHGYAGDYRIIEWMYDLENDRCDDPTQPAIVNCLDYIFSTVHSVRSVQERRRRFAELLGREYRRRAGRLRVLDVASGGSRYTRDFLATLPDVENVRVTVVDQDPAAIAYCRNESFRPWLGCLTTFCAPVTKLAGVLSEGDFDVVISSGLFDYLDESVARPLLAHLVKLTADSGVTAIANFHVADPSRTVKEWLVDWPLIFRDGPALAALFPDPSSVETVVTRNKALLFGASGRDRPVLGSDLSES